MSADGGVASQLAPGGYRWRDLGAGDWWDAGAVTVDAAKVAAFVALTGDDHPVHVDDAAARAAGYAGRIAHGLLVLSLADGLKMGGPVRLLGVVASLGWTMRFTAPVAVGETVALRLRVLEARATKTSGRGLVRFDARLTDRAGAVVQAGDNATLMAD